jgi:hypothetical protein
MDNLLMNLERDFSLPHEKAFGKGDEGNGSGDYS